MSSAIPSYTPSSFTWEEVLREFFLRLQATRAKKTQQYYKAQVGGLARWAIGEDVPFSGFGKRHMDRFLVSRVEEGKAPLTLHHAAVCAKAFFHWCQKNDIVERSLLADYQVRHAPRPAQYMPADADMQTLLKSVPDYWNPAKNPRPASTRSPSASSTATITTPFCWDCLTPRPGSARCCCSN